MRAVTGTRLETWLPAKAESAGAARSIVREAAAAAGLDGEPAWDLMVATTEAVTNAVQHGRPWPNGCVLFVTEPCPRGLRVEVTDLGTFESTLAPPRSRRRPAAGFLVGGVIERLPVGLADPLAFPFGQLVEQVAHTVNGAVLAVRGGPALLDRLDQSRRAVGHDQQRCAQPAGDQVPAECQPVLA
jgi:anti-sigma regulatory factor (Ser/Thr protein kinase)